MNQLPVSSVQLPVKPRASGFYWVKTPFPYLPSENGNVIGEFDGGVWNFCGVDDGFEESEITVISEKLEFIEAEPQASGGADSQEPDRRVGEQEPGAGLEK
jgi:hypothetical protein